MTRGRGCNMFFPGMYAETLPVASFGSGKPGAGPGEFSLPTTIEIDSRCDLYVTELDNERVQKIDPDGKSLLIWGSRGSGNNQFCHQEHLVLDKYDNVYVNDPQSDPGCSMQPSIKKFDKSGHFITKIGTFGEEPGQFEDPEHLAIDSDDNIYISDRGNNRIQAFRHLTNIIYVIHLHSQGFTNKGFVMQLFEHLKKK